MAQVNAQRLRFAELIEQLRFYARRGRPGDALTIFMELKFQGYPKIQQIGRWLDIFTASRSFQ